MLVRRPELDAVEARLGQVLDDGRDVPVLGDVVGDGAELQTLARRRGGSTRSLRLGAMPSAGTAATVDRNSRRLMAERLAHFAGLNPALQQSSGPRVAEGPFGPRLQRYLSSRL